MSTIEVIRKWLSTQVGRLPDLAQESGVNYWWLLKFKDGAIKNPGFDKIHALQKYKRRQELIAARKRSAA